MEEHSKKDLQQKSQKHRRKTRRRRRTLMLKMKKDHQTQRQHLKLVQPRNVPSAVGVTRCGGSLTIIVMKDIWLFALAHDVS
eukprot:1405482-Karenia_brevis.AAC.1